MHSDGGRRVVQEGPASETRPVVEGQSPSIVLDAVTRQYRGRDGAISVVLDRVAAEFPAGTFTAVVGPSGCGKSTLLSLVAGLSAPDGGQVLRDGAPIAGAQDGVGFLFQQDALLPWKTVADNVGLSLTLAGVPRGEVRDRVDRWLTKVGLPGAGRLYPSQLSGGMRKRAGLAQVLIREPRLILMDEPFSSLDVQMRNQMETDLLAMVEDGETPPPTIIFVTHDLEEAIALADRVILMSAGPAASVRAVHHIPLPRPRDVENIRAEPAFSTLYAALWEGLREEVHRHRGSNLAIADARLVA